MRAVAIIGTRPEIVKLAPVLKALTRVSYRTVLTGQHYDDAMVAAFFEDLDLPAPDCRISSTRGRYGLRLGDMVDGVQEYLLAEGADVVMVQGDTDSVLAGALAAKGVGIPVAHVEAGLRSFDQGMAEERNRVAMAHLADLHFCPTVIQRQNLLRENVDPTKIYVVGNTIVDSLKGMRVARDEHEDYPGEQITVTLHRQENLDNPAMTLRVLAFVDRLAQGKRLPVKFPVHPNTRRVLGTELEKFEWVECLEPLPYRQFLDLLLRSALVITDSGGVQEECSVLGVPTVTVRKSTERPETVLARTNVVMPPELIGTDLGLHIICRLLSGPMGTVAADSSLGTGETGKLISDILKARFGG